MCYWTGGGLPDTLEDYPPEEDFAIPPAEVWNHALQFKLYTAKLPPHTFIFVGVGKASRWGLSECFDRAAGVTHLIANGFSFIRAVGYWGWGSCLVIETRTEYAAIIFTSI